MWFRGRSRSLKTAPFDRSYTSSYWRFIIMALCCVISENKARYWSKITIFSYHPAFDPRVRGSRRKIAIAFGVEKLE